MNNARAPRLPRAILLLLLCGLLAPGPALMAQSAGPAPSRLSNFSARAHSGTGDDVLIAGFFLHGSNSRTLLMRAVGPGLAQFGVRDFMIDPQLLVYHARVGDLGNANWSSDADLIAAHRRLGAFDLAENSRDASLLVPLAPGAYTVHARGRNGVVGEVLLEIYDAAGPHEDAPAIVNASLRGTIGSENATLIAGFVVTGEAPKPVLLRAIGPTLAQFGVAAALPDPRIRLHRNGVVVLENDDWAIGAVIDEVSRAFTLSGAFGLAPDSLDAAVVATLAPGAYTAHVTNGVPGGGIVLVEFYDLLPPPSAALPPPSPGTTVPAVSIVALDNHLVEGITPGARIRLVRTGDASDPLRVRLAFGGTAGPQDTTGLPATVTFAAGETTTAFIIGAWTDYVWEPTEVLAISIAPDPAYTIAGSGTAHVVIRDSSPRNGTGWQAEYFANRTLEGAPVLVRTDPEIAFDWGSAAPAPGLPADRFSVRWTGLLQVDTSQDYTLVTATDDGVRLWIDDELVIDRWVDQGLREHRVTLPLAAGVRYLVRMEYYDNSGRAAAGLLWQAAGMPRTVIDRGRVFAGTDSAPAVTSPTAAIALQGGPFSYTITASARPAGFGAIGLPAGLALDPATGTISGVPTEAGHFPVIITADNAHGRGAELLRLEILAAGLPPQGETWPSAPDGSGLESAPLVDPAARTALTELASAAPAGAAFERIRGYVTAPFTGHYRFWLSASGPAALHLADSDQPGDRVLRARLAGATPALAWTADPAQQTPLLALEAGRRYYFEVLHRPAATGAHVAVAWTRPGDPPDAPSGVVPLYALSRFDPFAPAEAGRIVYLAGLRPPEGVSSAAAGTVSLLFDEASLSGTLALQLSGLSSAQTSAYIYAGEPGVVGAQIRGLPLGSFSGYTWTLRPTGLLSAQDVADALRDGLLYVGVHTADHPGGELQGTLVAAAGSTHFVPPPEPAVLPPGTPDARAAARFLTQATFGPTAAEIERVRALGFEAWLAEQLALPASVHLPYLDEKTAELAALDPAQSINQGHRQQIWWQRAVTAPDQLRQRVAFALSQIFVVSDVGVLSGQPAGLAVYYDMLLENAFGGFRTLLEDVTLSPAMGTYLTMVRNRPPDPARGIYPDENYAREVMQLFTIGLNKLHPDGTLVLDTRGLPIATYDNDVIIGLAHVFTGWGYHSANANPTYTYGTRDYRRPMMVYPAFHATVEKRLLDGMILPGGGTAEADLAVVLDLLHHHPNTGPFICRQLIQRLVTSNPGPAYVHRTARVFADNGSGVRGDLGAVVRAILLDPEARSSEAAAAPGFGKLREPVLRLSHLWRAFHAAPPSGIYNYTAADRRIGQAALRAPTVFNFFEPAYVPAGVLVAAGLAGPEFQIMSENAVISLTNEMRTAVFSYLGPGTDRIVLDLSPAEALASDPAALVDWLDLLLMSGSMPADMRSVLVAAVTAIPASNPLERARTAVNLVTIAPHYAVQK